NGDGDDDDGDSNNPDDGQVVDNGDGDDDGDGDSNNPDDGQVVDNGDGDDDDGDSNNPDDGQVVDNGDGDDDDDDSNNPDDGQVVDNGDGDDDDDDSQNTITITENFAGKSEQESGKVDILWVVDNSGSMENEQAALSYNFDIFINQFIDQDIDFQMGITTTDPRRWYNGDMVGDPSKLNSSYAKSNESSFLRHFKNQIQVGTNGYGEEMGLKTMKSFLEKNSSIFRDDAYLAIVILSDEEEQSSSSANNYVNFLSTLKPNAGMVKVHSIVTKELNNNQWETVGQKYLDVSSATNGIQASIKEDFFGILQDMGEKIVTFATSFPLSNTPIESSLEVYINDELQTSGWSFDASINAVKFDENMAPQDGDQIKVVYETAQ
ncbi:MAG: hypothetical protein HOE90_23035, partial [Bacteriovoracaceae bacterium]|nr:hypothetical protein [Bacteriovoracaceae bacterium]